MQRIIEEQEKLFENFDSPYEFIKYYGIVYNTQQFTPRKVFLNDIPYFKKFEANFIDDMLKNVLKEKNPANIKKYLLYCENILSTLKSYSYYDKIFYELCIVLYKKSLIFMIDRFEAELVSKIQDMSADYKYTAECYVLLRHFSDIKLDISPLIIETVCSNLDKDMTYVVDMFDSIFVFKNLIKEINSQSEDSKSSFSDGLNTTEKINITETILGTEVKNKYNFDEIIQKIIEEVKKFLLTLKPEDAYLKAMNFTSELVLRNVTHDEQIVGDMKAFSTRILSNE